MDSHLETAFDEFLAAVNTSVGYLKEHPFYQESENRAAGYAFLLSMVIARLEEDVIFDADYPYFRILDTRIREGGDNPDQRYLISTLNGADTYRIWGRLGSARRIDLQIYSGDPYVPGSGGRAASFLTFEQITFADDGTFEIIASSERQPGNWIENPPDATRMLTRQIFSTWSHDNPGDLHIDRVGSEGSLKPALTDDVMAARVRKATASLTTHVKVWPEVVRNNYLAELEPNHVSVPFDPGSKGGVPGRWMCHATFDLADDEALVIKTWPASGNYQGIQLADLWFSSLEYANRQTSLTADQAHLSEDGCYYFVVAAHDPGVANWLDTTGRRRGVILFRFDGTTDATFDEEKYPTASKVPLADLASHLPHDTPSVSPQQRRVQIASRRRHVQTRFSN
ncbi:MAG TPA: hypothetical protein VM282_23975 [Acidimicrobiales bacterium]|nr:hypothetical protein [Acidimicrobiales bacterium]